MTFPIDAVRARFPALHVTDDGRPRVYFDAPGGTQACADAIAAMAAHMRGGTANAGGAFATSIATDAMSAEAHRAAADLLNARPGRDRVRPEHDLADARGLARARPRLGRGRRDGR